MKGHMSIIFWSIVTLGVFGVSLWIFSNNSSDPRIAVKFFSSLLVGLLGFLLTWSLQLEREVREHNHPFRIFYEIKNYTPIPSTALYYSQYPHSSNLYPNHHYLLISYYTYLQPRIAELSNSTSTEQNDIVNKAYSSMLYLLMGEVLRNKFSTSWTDQFRDMSNCISFKDYLANRQDMEKAKSNSQQLDFFPKGICLPPKTSYNFSPIVYGDVITFKNDFVTVTISIRKSRWTANLRNYGFLLLGKDYNPAIESDKMNQIGTATIEWNINIKSVFNTYLQGHKQMPMYKHWVEELETAVAEFNSDEIWKKAEHHYSIYK